MTTPPAAVCVLHGGPAVPHWLTELAELGELFLVLNDGDDHPYRDVPARATVLRNTRLRGFAENANSAVERAFDDGHETVCVLNFDLELAVHSVIRLLDTLQAEPHLALVGAVLTDAAGRPTFSVGTQPTPTKEFLRAAGLRSQRLLHAQRALLRRGRQWSDRNAVTGMRPLSDHEYLPWTCVALRQAAWRDVGGLDERFPLYAEDIDWSLRCHRSGWTMALVDVGTVVHHERATRGPRSDALYEYSHLELHRKWGWPANLAWQKRGLTLRRHLLNRLVAPLDWASLTNVDRGGER